MAEEIKPRTPRRIKWLLGVSLALNLAVVGLIAGAVLRHDGPGRAFARAPGAESYAAPYVTALPRAERRAIFRAVRNAAGADMPDRAARRALYTDVIAALRSEPFEPAALKAALDAQKNASLAVQSSVQTEWLERVSAMSASQRADYAFAIEDILRRGPKRGKP